MVHICISWFLLPCSTVISPGRRLDRYGWSSSAIPLASYHLRTSWDTPWWILVTTSTRPWTLCSWDTSVWIPEWTLLSITQSKHIRAVKKPWRRSSKNNPLSQILTTVQRLDKFTAARTNFISRGWLPPRLNGVSSEVHQHRTHHDDDNTIIWGVFEWLGWFRLGFYEKWVVSDGIFTGICSCLFWLFDPAVRREKGHELKSSARFWSQKLKTQRVWICRHILSRASRDGRLWHSGLPSL